MLEFAKFYLFLFGVLTIVGGTMGFVKAGSRASLIAGSISGILLLVAGYLTGSAHAQAGLILGLVLSLALTGQFAPKFLRTKKPMPAGMMALLGVIGIIATIAGLLK